MLSIKPPFRPELRGPSELKGSAGTPHVVQARITKFILKKKRLQKKRQKRQPCDQLLSTMIVGSPPNRLAKAHSLCLLAGYPLASVVMEQLKQGRTITRRLRVDAANPMSDSGPETDV